MAYNDEKFNKDSKEFCVHWDMGREAARKATIKLNDMVTGLHEQHNGWSYTKISKTIWLKHQHLEGFTPQTIRKKLDDNNLKLLDSNKQHTPKPKEKEEDGETIEQNIVMEQSGYNDHNQKVIEQSSTNQEPQITEEEADEILKEDEATETTEEEPTEKPNDILYDPDLLNEKIQEIAKKDERIQELESTLQDVKKEKVESAMSRSLTTEYSIELSDQDLADIAKNGGIEPLLLTLHPDGKTQTAKLDRTRLNQKKKR